MNKNATKWNGMVRNLTAENPSELRLMDVESALRMVDNGALTKDSLDFNTKPGIQWMSDAFQTRIEEVETELRTMVNPVARGSPAGRQGEIPRASAANESSGNSSHRGERGAAHSQL